MCFIDQHVTKKSWDKTQQPPRETLLLNDRTMISGRISPLATHSSWWPWVRYIQKTLCFSTTFCIVIIFVILSFNLIVNFRQESDILIRPTPDPLIMNKIDFHQSPDWNRLLDLKEFRILKEPIIKRSKDYIFLLNIVHSKPDHFRQRQLIRATWGSIRNLGKDKIVKTIFILGVPDSRNLKSPIPFDVMRLIRKESQRHGDLLIGNFIDHYRNLSYKNIFGLKWSSNLSPLPTLILKTDDDAFIDLPGFHKFLERTYDPIPKRPIDILACSIVPPGTTPFRDGKWSVKEEEYPWDEYPKYCAGLAYAMSSDVAEKLYILAESGIVPHLWVDDVWVTGIIASHLSLQYLNMNRRYSYDVDEVEEWAWNNNKKIAPPFTFVHLDPSRRHWTKTLQKLWSHVVLAYNQTELDYR